MAVEEAIVISKETINADLSGTLQIVATTLVPHIVQCQTAFDKRYHRGQTPSWLK